MLGLYVVVLLGITLAPLPSTEGFVEILPYLDRVASILDKFVHAVLFGGLTLLILWNLDSGGRRGVILQAVGLALAAAALVEILQSPLPYRHGDVFDFAAGGAGAVVVAIVVAVLQNKQSRTASAGDA